MIPQYPEFCFTKERYRCGTKLVEGTITRSLNESNLGHFKFERVRYKLDGAILGHDNFRVAYDGGQGRYQGSNDIEFSVRRRFCWFNEVHFTKNGTHVSFFSRLGGSHPKVRTEWHNVFYLYLDGSRSLYGIAINQKQWTNRRMIGGGYKIEEFANAKIEERLGFDLFPLILWAALLGMPDS